MRRRQTRPFGQSITKSRVTSLLLALLIIGLIYNRLSQPGMWRWLVGEPEPPPGQVEVDQGPETIVFGANDLEPPEVAQFQETCRDIKDRHKLLPAEMDAYWKLLGWSRSQSFAELEQRAQHDVPFTRFWDQPTAYRGKPIALRIHVRRVLEYPATKNSLGVEKLYEAWGPTDESKSFPYVIVFAEKPDDLPVGTEVNAEVSFVGYFLKTMAYRTFDSTRASPLLLGRVRLLPKPVRPTATPLSGRDVAILLIVLVLAAIAFTWYEFSRRRTPRAAVLPAELPASFSIPGPPQESAEVTEIPPPKNESNP